MNLFRTASTQTRNKSSRRSDGFVLIEVLVSMTVFAIGIMAVLTAVLSTLDLQKDSTLRFRAGLILQEKLAETVMVPYGGQPARGISPDGIFSWTVSGTPWTDAPNVPKLITSNIESHQTGQNRNSTGKISRRGKEKSGADSLEDRVILVVVDVSWKTSEGSRSIQATQLVHAAPQARGMP